MGVGKDLVEKDTRSPVPSDTIEVGASNSTCNNCGQNFKLLRVNQKLPNLLRCDSCGEEHQLFSPILQEMADGAVKCKCGGTLSSSAVPRCPFCLSADIVGS